MCNRTQVLNNNNNAFINATPSLTLNNSQLSGITFVITNMLFYNDIACMQILLKFVIKFKTVLKSARFEFCFVFIFFSHRIVKY